MIKRVPFFLVQLSKVALLSLCLCATIANAQTKDKKGSSDHPLIERFPDTYIQNYKRTDFARLNLPKGPITREHYDEQGRTAMPPVQTVEGELTQILYKANSLETSALRIFRSFETAFEKSGFTPLFTCESDKECGRKFIVQTFWYGDNSRKGAFLGLDAPNLHKNFEYFFWSGFAKSGNQDYAVTLLVSKRIIGNFAANVALEIAEIEPLELEDVAINLSVDSIETSIEATGSAVLDGIFFEFNEATLTDESKDSIKVIAEYLTQYPKENYYVVGHTDNVGEFSYNMQFSKERAASVIGELVNKGSIDPKRLLGAGAGPISPVSSNQTDEGRALNRRVELVLDK